MLNRIQNELLSIDAARFQKLCDTYLYRSYNAANIDSVGSVPGRDKTRIGTPDSLLTLPNNKFVFVEYTTQRDGVVEKFLDDLEKCFDEGKTKVSLDNVEKITLVCNTALNQDEKSVLANKCSEHGVVVDIIDLSKLSFELYQKYQYLAKEYLGIELDSGQILPPDEFVRNYQLSKFATPLDNPFHFRVKEREEILEALTKVDIVLVTGAAGAGKSKLALQIVQEFVKANPAFTPFCISNRNLDLYENLKTYFGPDGNSIVLVDDANRLSQLAHILQLVNEQTERKKVKLILTVREYALDQVEKDARTFATTRFHIPGFSDKEIAEIIEDGFGIKNYDYLLRITRIANGNPRLAMMAATIAVESNSLERLNDVSDIYDEYFVTIHQDLEEQERDHKDLIQIAGIIAFCRFLDRTNTTVFEKIASAFGLSSNALWIGLERLHELEMVDMDYDVAKISDQVLATYLFYKVFFQDGTLDFGILLTDDFENYDRRLVEALNPALDTFNATFIVSQLKPALDKRWMEIRNNEPKALAFIKQFSFAKETEFLLYLKERIEAIPRSDVEKANLSFTPEKYQPIKDQYLEVLRHFHGANIESVLSLLFTYLEKDLRLLPQVVHLLTEDFSFHLFSHHFNYQVQECVINELTARMKGPNGDLYTNLFLRVARAFLRMRFRSNTSRGLTVTLHTFPLRPWEALLNLRSVIWTNLFAIFEQETYRTEVLDVIDNYAVGQGRDDIVKEIGSQDNEIVLPFIVQLDMDNYRNCVVADHYFDFLARADIPFDGSLRLKLSSKTFRIAQVLLHDDRHFGMPYDEYEAQKAKEQELYFGAYTHDDFVDLFRRCNEIQSGFATASHKLFQLHRTLIEVLISLIGRDRECGLEVIKSLLDSGNNLRLPGFHIVGKLLEDGANPSELYEIFIEYKETDPSWIFAVFQSLPAKHIDEHFFNKLMELYDAVPLQHIPDDLVYLDKYSSVKKEVLIKVIRRLFDRVKNNEGHFSFQVLFNPHTDIFKELEAYFAHDHQLLQEVYLYAGQREKYFDYKCAALEKIVALDFTFMFSFLDDLYQRGDIGADIYHDGNLDLSFAWGREKYTDELTAIVDFVLDREKDRYSFLPSYFELFLRNLQEPVRDIALSFLESILLARIHEKAIVHFITTLIANFFPAQRKRFVELFLQFNKNPEDFKLFSFEGNHMIAQSPAEWIATYEENVSFYESLLPLFNSPDLLGHKLFIEERIASYRERIESERKSIFIER